MPARKVASLCVPYRLRWSFIALGAKMNAAVMLSEAKDLHFRSVAN